jgi:cell division septation protein DedD
MDTGLKQRLIGAIVLIVLALIFVPMLFDRPAPTTADVGLPTEAQPPGDFNTRIVALTPPTAAPTSPPGSVSSAPVDDPNRVATIDTNAPARVDAVSGERVGGGAVDATATAPAPAPDAGAIRRDPEPAAPAAAVPSVPPPATPADSPPRAPEPAVAAPPPAAPSAPAPRPAPAAGAGRFVVVFGSFGQAANADALVADLRRGGIEARGEPTQIGGRAATRVLAGPYRDRAAAEQVRLSARQVRSDLTANIVEVDDTAASRAPTGAASTAAPAAPSGTGWAVQIGAYQSATDAGAQRDRVSAAGFNAFIDQVRTERGTLYRVRVGPAAQRAGAEQLRADVRARLAIDGLVVSHP